MSDSMDFVHLREQIETMRKMIDDANRVLENPSSAVSQADGKWDTSDLTSRLATRAKEMIRKGKPVWGGVLAGGLPYAAAIDLYRNHKVKTEARKQLLYYYEQLASKHSQIVAEQLRLHQMMLSLLEDAHMDEAQRRERIQNLKPKQEALLDLLDRFNNLEKQV